ncbi:MAG: hypothetical protein Q8L07_08110 [Sediminibacterium sp.]|nr:hypothetical protein [Sediminibacterium sp.]MDP3667095.1 hypothetical protein [Sediminibacterium sp.]
MKKIFLSMMVFGATAFTLSAQTADEIIEKYITAIGGADKWTKVQSIKVEGQVEVQGLAIPYTMQGLQLKGMRVDAEFQGNIIIDIVTPTNGWSQNPLAGKNTLSPITEEELKSKVDDLDIQDAFIEYQTKGSAVEFLGKDEEDGNEYFKIKMTSKNNNEKTYFFDTKTYLIYKIESVVKQQGQEMKTAVKYLDYQSIDFGIKMPFKTDQGMMMMVIKKVTINPVVDESIFIAK